MSMFAPGNKVKVDVAVLEDPSQKSNHHLFQEVYKQKGTGEVLRLDTESSTKEIFKYWVKFHFFKILIEEKYLVLQ